MGVEWTFTSAAGSEILASLPLPLLTLDCHNQLHAANKSATLLFDAPSTRLGDPARYYGGRTRDYRGIVEETLGQFVKRAAGQDHEGPVSAEFIIPGCPGLVWYDTVVWEHEGEGGSSYAIMLLRQCPSTLPVLNTPTFCLGGIPKRLPQLKLPSRPSYSSSISSTSLISPRSVFPSPSLPGDSTVGLSVTSHGIKMRTSVPLPSPSVSPNPPTPPPPPPTLNSSQLLRLAAFEHLPHKAVIIASVGLTSGYVSPLAFEFLLGHLPIHDCEDISTRGVFSFDDGCSALSPDTPPPLVPSQPTTPHSFHPLRSPALPSSISDRMDPFDVRRITTTEPSKSRMAVTNILLRATEQMQSGVDRPAPESATTTTAGPLPDSRRPSVETDGARTTSSKKPYRVYNSTFSQRILDPLDPLLTHVCGTTPSASPPATNPTTVVIGIEVDTTPPLSPRRPVRRLIEVASAALSDTSGTHSGGILLLRDVTHGDKSHPNGSGSLARPLGIEGDAYFRHTIDNLPSIVWTTNAEGQHEFFNQRWYDFTGLEPEDSLDGGWLDCFHAGDLVTAIAAWRKSVETGTMYSTEYRCRRHDGVWVWMLGRAMPHKDVDGVIQGWVGTCTDIDSAVKIRTELASSEEDRTHLLASEKAAKEASRLKSTFVSNISHELRTPIAGIIGMAELLLSESDEELSNPHRVAVGKIMRSGEILLEMIGMTLDMSKVEAGKLDLEARPFLLQDVIGDANLFSIAAHKKGLEFSVESVALFTGAVLGDMPRLGQVFSNLLSNAIKFTPSPGSVVLRIAQERETSNTIDLKIEVEDTGLGIEEAVVPQLFQPFQQADTSTSRLFGGTGLGLVISKTLIELMGGTITLRSTYGKGTTMTVLVPLEKAPIELASLDNTSITDQTTCTLQREKVWILVAEDNNLIRSIITKTLSKMRFNVEAVCDGLEAIDALKRRRFDLVLMDRQMPRMDGDEATKLIRQSSDVNLSKVKIVALTASAMQGDEEICLAVGMNGYLSKPVRSKVLEATILRHLGSCTPSRSRRGSLSSTMEVSLTTAGVFDASGRRRPSHPSYGEGAYTV